MHARSVRHIAGVLAVTVASGLLFSVSALHERTSPAATSDLSTLVRNRQEQVRVLENEVSGSMRRFRPSPPPPLNQAPPTKMRSPPAPPVPSPDPASKSLSPTRPPGKFPQVRPPTTSSSTSRTSRTP